MLRRAKDSSKGAQRKPKGAKREPKVGQREPKRSQKGGQREPRGRMYHLSLFGHENGVTSIHFLMVFGAILGAKFEDFSCYFLASFFD